MKAGKHERLLDRHLPKVLPAPWDLREDHGTFRIYHRIAPVFLSVIAEVAEYGGRAWLHVSAGGKGEDLLPRIPTWEELKEVKDLFCGSQACALQVLPPASEYVNQFDVLHLWVALEGARPVPDFTRGTGRL